MIADHQTNTIYFADSTKYEYHKEVKAFKKLIESYGYPFKILKGAKDFYCRDYMPIQVAENDLVQFVYRPSQYIKSDEIEYIAHPQKVEMINNIRQPRYSKLVLDGGNIVKSTDKAIVTDRIFKDNLHQFDSEREILVELEKDLKSKVIIIPEYPGEKTGHADGLIRFIDQDTVLINSTVDEPQKDWLRMFLRVLMENQLTHINVPCTVSAKQHSADGLYINYLHVGNLIIVPQFRQKEDELALKTMQEVFGSAYTVVPFDARWIAKSGGVFNCASWCIKQ